MEASRKNLKLVVLVLSGLSLSWELASAELPEAIRKTPTKSSAQASTYEVEVKPSGKYDHKKLIESLKAQSEEDCLSHEGINCIRGPQENGSVFCNDGFSNSKQDWKKHCDTPHLKIISKDLDSRQLEVVLRNSTEAKARGVKLSGRIKGFDKLLASGPKHIEAWGAGSYSFSLQSPLEEIPRALRVFRLKVECENCGLSMDRAFRLGE